MQNSSSLTSFGRFLENRNVGRIFGYVVIPILILIILLLPPVQLLNRIQNIGHSPVQATSGEISDPDGTRVIFPAEGLTESGQTYARLTSVPRADFEKGETNDELRQAAEVLPGYLRPRSPVYELDVRGAIPTETIGIIPIPNDSMPYETLGIYNWNGESWEWLPHYINFNDDTIEFDVNFVPNAFVVAQTSALPPTVGVELPLGRTLPAEAAPAITTLYPTVVVLRGDGGVDGAEYLPDASSTPYETYITVRNYKDDGVPRTDLLANLLIDGQMQEIQINTVAELAASKLYTGVGIDFKGVDPPLRADFSRFVQNLATRLHQDGLKLTVFLDTPTQVSDQEWETYGYDWRAIGASADFVVLPGPQNPLAYAPGGDVEKALNYAVGEIDRRKLLLRLPAQSVEQSDNYFLTRGYGEALAPLMGEVTAASSVVEPGAQVNASLQAEIVASPLQFDPATGISWYRYRGQGGEERIVFLENASSLANKATMTNRFNLGGVVLQALNSDDSDPQIWSAMASYASGETPALPDSELQLNWRLSDSSGVVIVEQVYPLNQPASLTAPLSPGEYVVEAELLDNNQPVGSQGSAAVAVATYTPVPTPTPAFTPTPIPTPTPEFTPTPTPLPYAIATANGTTNLREGPGTAYNRKGQLQAGAELKIIGKNKNGTWWQLEGEGGKPVWIIANRVTVTGPSDQVAVATDIPEAPKVVAAPSSGGGGGGNAPPAGAGTFGYGMQIDPNADKAFAANAIKNVGFNWVKWQTPWKDLEGSPGQIGWGGEDSKVNFFAGQGLNVFASIVKSPKWARPGNTDFGVEGPPADPQTFANFLGAYAGRYCGKVKAIEVWNEQNLHYEWGNEPLDPARYMDLLKRSYQAIKAACPQMIVISGALTPAGNVGNLAIDDMQYLEGMYQNGLKNYSDAIGAHPSGFNVPPSIGWQQACDFITQDNASFRGPCDNPHHSWSARSTVEGYRNIMVKYGDSNKRLWPTEFGWAAGGALHPSYGYANDNSRAEQAAWTVEFYQWMKSTGYVGPAFLWNLNYGMTHPALELAQWGILDAGGGPHPVYNALGSMPK